MRHSNILLAVVATTLTASTLPAWAGGSAGSMGVGAEAQLSGLGGASANYDAGSFHTGGFFGYSDHDGPDNTDIALGGRFYYHLHSTAMSDFGVGGSVGLGFEGDRNAAVDNNRTRAFIEPGVQLRAFIAANICLSFTAGLSLGLIDASGIELRAQPVVSGGVHYYFF